MQSVFYRKIASFSSREPFFVARFFYFVLQHDAKRFYIISKTQQRGALTILLLTRQIQQQVEQVDFTSRLLRQSAQNITPVMNFKITRSSDKVGICLGFRSTRQLWKRNAQIQTYLDFTVGIFILVMTVGLGDQKHIVFPTVTWCKKV